MIHEVVALRPSAEAPPGQLLQIGADRWLAFNHQPMVPAGFVSIDVTGKWHELPPLSDRLLASCIDVEELFAQRDCARTILFDCPAILQKRADGCRAWIERSYVHAFNIAAQRAESR